MPASWLSSSRRSTPTDCSKSLGMVPSLAPGPVIGVWLEEVLGDLLEKGRFAFGRILWCLSRADRTRNINNDSASNGKYYRA